MPGFDQTGPMGAGPMTGRGYSPCVGCYPCGWGMGMSWKRGFGIGKGMGRHFGFCCWPQAKKDQTQILKDYRQSLKEELEEIDKELIELEKKD